MNNQLGLNVRDNADLQHDINRMNNVEKIINNPEYQTAFLTIKAITLTEFEKLGYNKVDDMQEANRTLKNLNRLESHFNRILTTGKIAEKTLGQKLKSVIGL